MLKYILIKETRIIIRDKAHLIFLFLMPAIFIIALSLALKDAYSPEKTELVKIAIQNMDQGKQGKVISEALKKNTFFKDEKKIKDFSNTNLTNKGIDLYIIIDKHFSKTLSMNFKNFLSNKGTLTEKSLINIQSNPVMHSSLRTSALTIINQIVYQETLMKFINPLQLHSDSLPSSSESKDEQMKNHNFQTFLKNSLKISQNTLGIEDNAKLPSTIQQSVPAWSLFAMFFIVLPLSASITNERNQNTLLRLKTMKASNVALLSGKIIPYIILNLAQLVCMILIGIYLMPLIGGEKLEIGSAYFSMLIMGIITALSATSFAMLIASYCKNQNQASTVGPPLIAIMAAFGGIMVPTTIMPDIMQNIASYSPLNWMLTGFLDIYLKNATIFEITPEIFKCLAFSFICLTIANYKLKK